jgi:hypothetical protein
MANPNIRTVTGKSTMPVGVSQSGTFTVNSTHTDRLDYSGTAESLNEILGMGQYNSEQENKNLWIYIPDNDLVVNIQSWGGTVVKVDGDCTGVSAATWELVQANLYGWSVLNQGGADGYVSGQVLSQDNSITDLDFFEDSYKSNPMDVIVIDGTSTSLLVVEKLG